MDNDSESKRLGKVVQINDARIQDHLGELVRGTVEETLRPTPYAGPSATNAPSTAKPVR